jgi:hypothetical protein
VLCGCGLWFRELFVVVGMLSIRLQVSVCDLMSGRTKVMVGGVVLETV